MSLVRDVLFICTVFFQASCLIEDIALEGQRYSSISESEWNIEVRFVGRGHFEMLYEVWLAGDKKKSDKNYSQGKWDVRNNEVVLVYDGIKEFYKLEADLDFSSEEFGPGLRFLRTSQENSLLRNVNLWKNPIKFLK